MSPRNNQNQIFKLKNQPLGQLIQKSQQSIQTIKNRMKSSIKSSNNHKYNQNNHCNQYSQQSQRINPIFWTQLALDIIFGVS
ncbi:UNKNOWN [Stylonychia lemnae]|uniref:Uncharacterized protein n=1 Tax=Stylonychia lemnae TaxID=5949 RepID=A0A078AQZ7_STYLE|nr:UNKNOWN [Stylonychia lemnae]|eukprot:CDW83677.1 UNKNOWN [Stylonychia lemnae]